MQTTLEHLLQSEMRILQCVACGKSNNQSECSNRNPEQCCFGKKLRLLRTQQSQNFEKNSYG